ncbi:XLF-domain-containing protein [Dissoconium aciculare CBS 342.82]|uniref:Non-homologous end-joining factor 1 n=1 Tax=Dissoconium aciculare CBS 342.82 TaxID=1314786 RepID=A0A6J3LSC2_9PEZI|nr:XLF-domain-containing protein [Dissoconium aciculare CBS 342.82]KAF1818189.1 XLF-domain-containing protein [Dissoconium aciculare CBS 342.82]
MSSPRRAEWSFFSLKQAREEATSQLPRLLVKTTFENGYEILLSDGCRVWREALSNDKIESRAREIRCAIEPSDPENREALFDLIRKSLSDSQDQKKDAKLGFSADEDGEEFGLRMSAPLVPPLPDLTWVVYLKLLPPSAISTYLLDPLLLYASEVRAQVDLLMTELAAKDHVLERICDRLEASGDSLTAVFPAKAGLRLNRNKSQRLQLGPHVPGLGTFDIASWSERWPKALQESAVDSSARKAEVLQNLPDMNTSQSTQDTSKWWQHIGNSNLGQEGLATAVSQTREQTVKSISASSAPVSHERPHLQRGNLQQPNALDESTNDEGLPGIVRNNPVPSRNPESSEQSSRPPVKKLGAVGGRSRTLALTVPNQTDGRSDIASPNVESDPVVKPKRLGAIGGRKKAVEEVPGPSNEVPATQPTSQLTSPPPKKARLGTIGGRAKHSAPLDVQQSTPKPTHNVDPPPSTASSVKLENHDEETMRGRQISEVPSSRARDETSRERADRKRQELKREIGEGEGARQKAAGAVKKKIRKF